MSMKVRLASRRRLVYMPIYGMFVRFGIQTSSRLCAYLWNLLTVLASRRRLVCVPIYTVVAAKLSSGILSFDSLDPLLASVVSLGVSFGTAGFISIVLHGVRGCISTSFVTSCDPTLRSLLTLR